MNNKTEDGLDLLLAIGLPIVAIIVIFLTLMI